MSEAVAIRKIEAPAASSELREGTILTTHRILEAFGQDAKTLDILHGDLFDSRIRVATSALRSLALIKDGNSLPHIVRVLQGKDPEVLCAAVHALERIATPEALRVLLTLSASTQEETVQIEILKALGAAFGGSPESRQFITTFSRAADLKPESRAAVLVVMLRLAEDSEAAAGIVKLAASDAAVLAIVFREACDDVRIARALLDFYAAKHVRLPVESRKLLISFATSLSSPAASTVFFESFIDPNPLMRQECYRQLGKSPEQLPHFDRICSALIEHIEVNQALEEQVLQSIDRMAGLMRDAGERPTLAVLENLPVVLGTIFNELKKACTQTIDTSHELGWLSANAREYIEFYCDEEVKKAFVQCLKSASNSVQRERVARKLKDSAVKVEVRHFEGYKLLHDLLEHPDRSGIAVVIRHLSLANVEKGKLAGRIKRCLSLARMSRPKNAKGTFAELYEWARQSRLYRLAERSLLALYEVDPAAAFAACRQCMTTPVSSKVLAITASGLIRETDLPALEPQIINLLHEQDRYVRLAVMDALASTHAALGENLLRAVLQVFIAEGDQELAAKLAELLGAKADVSTACAMIPAWSRFEEWKKVMTVSFLRHVAERLTPVKEIALTEFLYRVLREDPPSVLASVPTVLLALKDDYAVRVLTDLAGRFTSKERTALVRELPVDLPPEAVAAVWPLLHDDDVRLQETLGEVLPGVANPRAREVLLEMARTLRRSTSVESTTEEKLLAPARSNLSTAKDSYKFEKEHVRTCAVLFSDIQGYSTKAQELSSMEVTALIHEYESILLPIMKAHEGVLVKRMGDGHLFTFAEPLSVVMATIRAQKALARFNRLRPEKMRVLVRMGIHWGEVVEKTGDVFGNTVNVAARLQTVAHGGSICMSNDVYTKVSKWITANDLGAVTVKGITEPIRAYEPTEIALEVPADLDPTKRERRSPATMQSTTAEEANFEGHAEAEQLITKLAQTFQHMRGMVRRCVKEEKEATLMEEVMNAGWRSVQPLLRRLRQPSLRGPCEKQ